MKALISKWRRREARSKFEASLELLCGPRSIGSCPEELVVVCLVRDGANYIREFLGHYRDLGVERFAFVDNGSKDGTLEHLCGQPGVTVLRSAMPYRECKIAAKQFLADNFGQGGWVLLVDIDEFFQFPLSESVTLPGFLSYLNRHRFGAVACQMLDLFPYGALRQGRMEAGSESAPRQAGPKISFVDEHRYFSLAGMRVVPYAEGPCNRFGNTLASDGLRNFFGGIRYRKFGTDNFLTKHPLFRQDLGARFVNCHAVASARLADLSGLLLHYKYVEGFFEYVKTIAAEGSFHKGSAAYKAFESVLTDNPSFTLFDESAQRYTGTEQLIDQGFITVSERYRSYVAGIACPELGDARLMKAA